MVATIHFDTLKYVEKLKVAGISENQAKVFAEVQNEAFSESLENVLMNKLATKSNIAELKTDITELKKDVFELKLDNRLFKWMISFILSGVLTLLIKTFS